MSWIYILKDNFTMNPWTVQYEYFPVKKKYWTGYGPIALYRKYKNTEGICGWGDILELNAEKSSEIKIVEGMKLYDASYFQIKMRLTSFTHQGLLIDKEILRQFPAYNIKLFRKPLNPYTLYFDGGLTPSIEYIFSEGKYDFCSIYDIKENLWKYFIHLLREAEAKNSWFREFHKKRSECVNCGYKSETPYFFELHDTITVDFDREYIPVNKNDFIILCPNCHKSIHQEMKRGKVCPKKE